MLLQVLGGDQSALPRDTEPASKQAPDGGIPWPLIAIVIFWLVFGRSLWPLFFLSGWGGGRFGGFSGGSSSGGFSGGGGSFGGGGASGRW